MRGLSLMKPALRHEQDGERLRVETHAASGDPAMTGLRRFAGDGPMPAPDGRRAFRLANVSEPEGSRSQKAKAARMRRFREA
jgi:hypothetical protein